MILATARILLAAALAVVSVHPAAAAPTLPTAALTTETLPWGGLPTVGLPPPKPCTITVTDTHISCVGMTSTLYPSTVTSTAAIPCGRCDGVEMVPPPIMCLAVMPTSTIKVRTPSTSWTTVCQKTKTTGWASLPYETLPTENPAATAKDA